MKANLDSESKSSLTLRRENSERFSFSESFFFIHNPHEPPFSWKRKHIDTIFKNL